MTYNYQNTSIENIEGEIWKSVTGYKGFYEVSNKGRVKRLVSTHCLKERILKQNFAGGYLRVTFSVLANHVQLGVSKLVAIEFVPNPNSKPLVCHSDDDTKNNCDNNLWWGTQSENIKDMFTKGRNHNNLKPMFGKDNPIFGKHLSEETKRKLSISIRKFDDSIIDSAIKEVRAGGKLTEIAERYKISKGYLSVLVNGKNKRVS